MGGRARGGKETASFEYDKSWLENPLKFSLECAGQCSLRYMLPQFTRFSSKNES